MYLFGKDSGTERIVSTPLKNRDGRDVYELFLERHRAGSIIVTSNRDPDEWHARGSPNSIGWHRRS